VKRRTVAAMETEPPEPSSRPTIVAVVIAYGPAQVDPLLTQSLEQGTDGPIVVVRNRAFTPGANAERSVADRQVHSSLAPHEIVLDDNVGYAVAANIGAATQNSAGTDVVVFITPDVTVSAESIRQLAATFRDPLVGAAGPILHVGTETWFGGTWGKSGHAKHRLNADDPRKVRWIDGSCLAVRRSAFTTIGGFDEGTFLYGDDLGLCLRLERSGHRVALVETAEAFQRSGMRQRSGAHGYLLVRNEIRLSHELGGRTGALRTALRASARVAKEVQRARGKSSRRHHLRQAFGMTLGIGHGLAGTSGPPGKRLRSWSDITIAEDRNEP
jgi:N-acetylglucosaminyl-diphospho-decaprenol L-rhamnosyltransferase